MPELKMQLPQAPSEPWQDSQYTFDGAWMPDLDPALLGPENFATLQNLRYKDKGLEGVSGYTQTNPDDDLEASDAVILNGYHHRTEFSADSYNFVHLYDNANQGEVYYSTAAIGTESAASLWTNVHSDSAASLNGRFSAAPQGNMVYCNGKETKIWAGAETKIAAAFLCSDNSLSNPRDVTDKLSNALTDSENVVGLTVAATLANLVVMTTRPAQGFTFTVTGANAATDTTVVKYWNGTSMTAVSSGSDGTAASGAPFAQNGEYSFTDTASAAKPYHFQDLYLYAYTFEVDAASVAATISQVTADLAWQSPKDVWDGVYRQPIQFQYQDNTDWEDYTLYVNQSSDISTPLVAVLDALTYADDEVRVMFEEQCVGIRWQFLGGEANKNQAQATVKYWDGDSWVATTCTGGANDTTISSGSGATAKSMGQSGIMYWDKPSDEQKRSIFGSYGYIYQITWTDDVETTFSASVDVDLVYGIPAQQTIKPFDFSVLYKNRLMLGALSEGDEGNRMDFCATNAPDVWNGYDSSNHGKQSLYFGNEEKLTCATQLYNRFGSNIFAMLLVFKNSEMYLLTGDAPSDFQIFPVSLNTGCPAPLTLATAEVGFEAGENVQRQVAIWCSHSGPMMFDGAVVKPIRGIDIYFDPQEDEFVDWDYMYKARGWVDHTRKEYNLLLPSLKAGTSQSTNNVWLIYDLIRQKWFTKDTGTEAFPQSGWNTRTSFGEHAMYGGTATGKVIEFEEGTSWGCQYDDLDSGAGIEQKVRTGDFFPSNNIWDAVLLRKFKIICEKVSSALTINLNIHHYVDAADSAANVIWRDASQGGITGLEVDFYDMDSDDDGSYEVIWASAVQSSLEMDPDVGTDRLVRLIQDLNELGWAHSFEFSVTTTDVSKGWKPVAWGLRWRVERKDDMATE